MIYIPTITTKRELINEDYCLYSPSRKNDKIVIANKITIWDNHTFYLLRRLKDQNKHEIARDHYLWLIYFIKNYYQEGVTLITPDVDWLIYRDEIEEAWLKNCSNYPQLYVPDTWNKSTRDLNIIGYALRKDSKKLHSTWNHCLGHIRDIDCPLLTYDSSKELKK